MEKNEYIVMHDIEQSYWWFVGKQFLVKSVMKRLCINSRERGKILDIGCGTGVILKLIEDFGVACGMEMSSEAIRFLQQRNLNLIVQSDANQIIPFRNNIFSVITCLDVLEHLDNDLSLIEEMFRVCKPGGHVVITVPAFQILWSPHDVALHHKRRYTKKQILRMIHQLNWRVINCSYYNAILFFPILGIRILKKYLSNKKLARSDFFVTLPAWLNRALCLLFLCEMFSLKYLKFPFGVSLLLILQKPNRV